MNPASLSSTRARRAAITVPDLPYGADFFAEVVVDVPRGADLRQVLDAVRAHPTVVAVKAQATTLREKEAVIGSTASLARRTAQRSAAEANEPPF